MKLKLTTLLLIIAAAAAAPAFGEERWYQVELIVFERQSVDDSEVWPEDPDMPDLSRARELTSSGDAFRPLPASQLKLGGARNRLTATSGYKVIKHVAWRQPGLARERAIAVRLHSDERPERTATGSPAGPRLDGTVRLILARYLHLEVNLALREQSEPAYAGGAEESMGGFGDGLDVAAPTIYRMVDSRRMRSGETHYIDHPKIGVIALVTPL